MWCRTGWWRTADQRVPLFTFSLGTHHHQHHIRHITSMAPPETLLPLPLIRLLGQGHLYQKPRLAWHVDKYTETTAFRE